MTFERQHRNHSVNALQGGVRVTKFITGYHPRYRPVRWIVVARIMRKLKVR